MCLPRIAISSHPAASPASPLAIASNADVYTYGFNSPGLIYYLGRPVKILRAPGDVAAQGDVMVITDQRQEDAKKTFPSLSVRKEVKYEKEVFTILTRDMKADSSISVLVPILNEEESLLELHERLMHTLEPMGRPFEIIYINDGSTDHTQDIIENFRQADRRVKIIEFNRNYGQHMALFAGFERATGDAVLTIDADLQNPPEEIPRLVEKVDEGYDVVATYRRGRKDSLLRKILPTSSTSSRPGS